MEPTATESGPGPQTDPPHRETTGLAATGRALIAEAEHLRDQTREAIPAVDIGFSAFERDTSIGGFLLAGAIAFRLFVYLLPMYLLALVVAGAALSVDPKAPEDLASSAGMSDYVASTIGDAASTSSKSLWLLVPVTLYALASAGYSAHKAIAAAHARAWGLAATPKRKAHLAALGFLGFSVAVGLGSRALSLLHGGVLLPVGIAAGLAFYGALWMIASWLLPRAPGTTVWALVPGALLVAAGTQGLLLFNLLYLNRKISSASEAYGALGVAGSILLWLYLLGRLLVAAPVLNATLWERSHPSPR